jgi:hypothetical protein
MRKFQVGDKVKWYAIDDCPMWDFNHLYSSSVKKGEWVEGTVTRVDADDTFFVDGWRWPQPDHCRALYGEPGYLELVEAVKGPRYIIVTLERPRRLEIFREGSWHTKTSFPEVCRPELEALCAKLNKGEG